MVTHLTTTVILVS